MTMIDYLNGSAFLRLNHIDETWAKRNTHPEPNVEGSSVRDLQRDLAALGFDPGAADGWYGRKTQAAVRAFQEAARTPYRSRAGLLVEAPETFLEAADGVFGKATQDELHEWQREEYTRAEPPSRHRQRPTLDTGADDFARQLAYAGHVLAIAAEEIGVREEPRNSNRGERVETYQHASAVKPGHAWCHAFAYWCHDEAALRMEGVTTLPQAWGGSVRAYLHARTRHVHTYTPEDVVNGRESIRPGDVGIMVRHPRHRASARAGNLHSGHTFLLTGERDGDVVGTIEGNTNLAGSAEGGGVYARTRELSDAKIIGFIRPTVEDPPA